MGVDGAHHLKVLPLERQLEHLDSNGADAIVDGPKLLLHVHHRVSCQAGPWVYLQNDNIREVVSYQG
jgi:hypothetical protein